MKLVNNKIVENAHKKDYIAQEKDVFSQLQRTIKLFKYENVKKNYKYFNFVFFLICRSTKRGMS